MSDEVDNQRTNAKRRQENAIKAKELADELFPNEQWILLEEGIYLSPRRPIGEKTSFEQEKRDARILRNLGSTIYFTPEVRSDPVKKFDAIVDGMRFEFKSIAGNANTLEHQFLRSRSQAPNVFINLENSNLSKKEVVSTLYGARNKRETDKSHGYAYYNRFKGGIIILKIKEPENLVYLDVDDLKVKRQ